MIVLDTTVLVYAVGTDHPLRAPSQSIIQRIGDGSLEATTTVEVIQEFVHVRARRKGRDNAARLARRYASLLAPLGRPDAVDLSDALDIFEEHDDIGAFDAVLAAHAIRRGAALVSADSGFAAIPVLRHLTPEAV